MLLLEFGTDAVNAGIEPKITIREQRLIDIGVKITEQTLNFRTIEEPCESLNLPFGENNRRVIETWKE
jgi:hypothetical protein